MQKEVIKPDSAKIPQKPDNAFEPPHSVHLHFKKRQIAIRVTLHKIPEKYVNIVPLAGKFHVDTVGWTKKAWLQLSYPQGAKVDVDRGQAVLDAGILTVTLPLSECIDKETGERVKFDKHGDIVVEKKESKKSKKAAPEEKAAEVKQPTKKSPKKQPEPETSAFEDKMDVSDEDESESESEEQEKPQKQQQQQQKKKKVPVHAMTPEQLEEKRMRQQKKAPAAKDFALSVIDQLAAVEDKKRTDFLKKEDQKLKHFEEKEKVREEKKQAKQERAKIAAQQALAERKKKLKAAREAKKAMEEASEEADAPAPKPEKKRKVSFSSDAPKATKKSKTN